MDEFHSPDAAALQKTCEETGGRFIESSKVDVDDIVGLLSQSIKSSEVRPKYGENLKMKFSHYWLPCLSPHAIQI